MMGPCYWMDETSGILRPAVMNYLRGQALTEEQIRALRAYLRQWIESDVWVGDERVDRLRKAVDGLTSRKAIDEWMRASIDIGIDPL
jgi:hypothetical protein